MGAKEVRGKSIYRILIENPPVALFCFLEKFFDKPYMNVKNVWTRKKGEIRKKRHSGLSHALRANNWRLILDRISLPKKTEPPSSTFVCTPMNINWTLVVELSSKRQQKNNFLGGKSWCV